MGARSAIWEAANGILAVLVAPPCASCHRPLEAPLASVVCDECWRGIRLLRAPYCGVCGDSLPSWRPAGPRSRCDLCRLRRSHISAGRAIGDYDGSLRTILHALKYQGRRSIAVSLGHLLRRHGPAVLAGADLVVPVPLHWRKRWQRGFNQAHELARGLGPPVRALLKRRRWTRSQTGLSVDARRANVQGAFVLSSRLSVANLSIVLVDDVVPTGATLEACARALMEGGARDVRTLTAARVANGRPPGRPHSPRPSGDRRR